jgi:hypothetical protein
MPKLSILIDVPNPKLNTIYCLPELFFIIFELFLENNYDTIHDWIWQSKFAIANQKNNSRSKILEQ